MEPSFKIEIKGSSNVDVTLTVKPTGLVIETAPSKPRRKPQIAPSSLEGVIPNTEAVAQSDSDPAEASPRPRRPRPIIALPTRFTAVEVAEMNDFEIVAHFKRITKCDTLTCTHCKGHRPLVPFWINSIRGRCLKTGISVDMKLPKTCDAQQARNHACNPVNNPAYQSLRSENTSESEKQAAIETRLDQIKQIGLVPHPNKYKPKNE
jgi:hypothetical protein